MRPRVRSAEYRDFEAATLLDSIDLIAPHQANKTMVIKLAADAGLALDKLLVAFR